MTDSDLAISLATGWTLHVTAAGASPEPPAPAAGATTVSLPAQLSDVPDDADAWLQRAFELAEGGPYRLRWSRVGPLAEVWIDGVRVAQTRNLFRSHDLALTLSAGWHRIAIHLPSPARDLAQKRPRPRWRTRLVAQQQLRFLRTPLLGRIPSWADRDAPRGVLGGLSLRPAGSLTREDVFLRSRIEGTTGIVELRIPPWADAASGSLQVGDHVARLARDEAGWHATLTLEQPPVWWPHSHGTPALLPVSLTVSGAPIELGNVGFRTVEARLADARFALYVNGEPVFCRGAVFVPQQLDAAADRAALEALVAAGGNMVRVGGTMRYEDRRFFAACDELGVLVWQDFMFANMDYPIEDDAFRAEVVAEADEQLRAWAAHPSLAVLCGGSEVAQQAAMVGQPVERWYGRLFEDVLPGRCATLLPTVPYVLGSPSSPSGADGPDQPAPLPFRVDRGIAHYYGVGAYLRPFDDARRADVTFASECLGLANVPEPEAVEALFGDDPIAPHTPAWKTGVPRDHGAGWDFDDVRDHYLERLFGLDARALRYSDPERYLELSRITSVEVMTRVFSEWRRAGSRTSGGLVWFLRDLRPGAGWGLLDRDGNPKASLLALPRVWSPTALLLTDEGTNGLRLHVAHEGEAPRRLRLQVALYRGGDTLIAEAHRDLVAAPRSTIAYDVEGLLGGFRDVGWAYRFGPRGHDALLARIDDEAGRLVGEAAHFDPMPHSPPDPHLQVAATRIDERSIRVTITTTRLAHYVCARVPGWRADRGYFHLAPGTAGDVVLRAARPVPARGFVHALGAAPARLSVS